MGFLARGPEKELQCLHDSRGDSIIVFSEIGEEHVTGTQTILRPRMYGDVGFCQAVDRRIASGGEVMYRTTYFRESVVFDLGIDKCPPVATLQ